MILQYNICFGKGSVRISCLCTEGWIVYIVPKVKISWSEPFYGRYKSMSFQDPNQNIYWQGWLTHTYVRLIHRKKWNKLCNSVFDLKIKFCKEAWIKLRWHALGPCNFFFFVYFFCGRGGGWGVGLPIFFFGAFLLLFFFLCFFFFFFFGGGGGGQSIIYNLPRH